MTQSKCTSFKNKAIEPQRRREHREKRINRIRKYPTVLIDLLIEKKIFTREEFAHKARDLDTTSLSQLVSNRRLELLSNQK